MNRRSSYVCCFRHNYRQIQVEFTMPTLKSTAFDKSRKGVEDYKRDHFFESFCGHNQLPVSCYGVRKCQPLFMGSERPMCVSVISSVV